MIAMMIVMMVVMIVMMIVMIVMMIVMIVMNVMMIVMMMQRRGGRGRWDKKDLGGERVEVSEDVGRVFGEFEGLGKV